MHLKRRREIYEYLPKIHKAVEDCVAQIKYEQCHYIPHHFALNFKDVEVNMLGIVQKFSVRQILIV